MRYILYFFLLYFAFQFIFRVVVPLFIAGKQLRKGFKQMKEQMENQLRQEQPYASGSSQQRAHQAGPQAAQPAKPNREDYLDFEEVKEE
jgi:hypothetical protein